MLVVLIAVAAVAVGLLIALALASRQSTADTRAHRAELESLTSAKNGFELQLAAERARASDLEASGAELAAGLAAVEAERDVNAERVLALRRETADLQTRIVELEEAVEAARMATDPSSVSPQTLWELVLTRSERTWRHSVAPNPEDDSPFVDTDDPLRLAVEIEASALREEVGAFLSVDWRAEPVKDPARAHLTYYLARELLAAAAREPEPAELIVEGDGELTLRIRPSDEDDLTIDLEPPDVVSQLIDVSRGEGLTVVVRAS